MMIILSWSRCSALCPPSLDALASTRHSDAEGRKEGNKLLWLMIELGQRDFTACQRQQGVGQYLVDRRWDTAFFPVPDHRPVQPFHL